MEKLISYAVVAVGTLLFGMVALVPALFLALPAAYFGDVPYDVFTFGFALAGGFWAARASLEF